MNYAGGPPTEVYDVDRRDEPVGPDDDGAFDLRAIVAMVWRAKWKILAGGVVGVILAAVYVSSLEPTYTASAKVLFMPEQRNVVDIEDVIASPSATSDLNNQIEILRSTNLMMRVVERLNLQNSPAFNPALRPEPPAWQQLGQWVNPRNWIPWGLLTDLGVVSPPPPPQELTPEERAERDRKRARNILMAGLQLNPVPQSRVIRISITTSSPRTSARVVNAVAQEYITAQLDAKLAATREATSWLSERVKELEDELQAAEGAVADYRAQLQDETGQTADVLQQQLNATNEALTEASNRRAAAEIRYERAREALSDTDEIASVAEFQQSSVISNARERERELVADRAELARLVPEGHERLELLDSRIERVRSDIREEARRITETLRNQMQIAAAEESDLRAKVTDLEERLQEQNEAEVKLRQLEREAEASRLIYENFLGRLKETTQQAKLEEADAVVLSPAEPPGAPDGAAKNRILALGLILGSGLGFGVSFLLERLNNTFRSVEQLQDMTGRPVLGSIPWVGKSRTRDQVLGYVLEKPSSALAESIRSLRTSLLFSRVDAPPHVVMFTSTMPGEGKSTTSLLLALTSAQMGKSAVIVDCDLRRPTLTRFFGERVVETSGIRGVLDGSLSLEDAIFHDPTTGLNILSTRAESGTVINAADVLSSEKFGEMLGALRARFDLVILDAPPTLSVADARVISQRVDTTLYCVRWDHTPRETVMDGLREFALVKPNIAGIVATMVDLDKAARYGYSGYGYGSYYRSYGDPYYHN